MSEIEKREQLLFLDAQVTRKGTSNLDFDVLQNITHTYRYMPNNLT